MSIKEQVECIVQKYKTRDPLEIAEKMGCIIVRYPLKDVRGFYHYFQRNHIIYIDDKLPKHIERFVIAHELGHIFLHKKNNAIFMDTKTYFTKSKYENEANLFAMNLLISDEEIKENIYYTESQLARFYGYHRSLINLRLKDFKESNEKI